MKRFLSNGLSALLLTVATSTLSLSASSTPLPRNLLVTHSDLITASAFTVKAPSLIDSSALGNHHVIRLAVGEKSLKNLTINIPLQMAGYSQLQVVDSAGKELSSKISTSNHQVVIAFDPVIAPGSSIEVVFSGVSMILGGGETLEYEISAGQDGLTQQIPVGVARVHVLFRD